MITPLLIIILALTMAGLGALRYGLQHVSTGYEDEYGFHEGVMKMRRVKR